MDILARSCADDQYASWTLQFPAVQRAEDIGNRIF